MFPNAFNPMLSNLPSVPPNGSIPHPTPVLRFIPQPPVRPTPAHCAASPGGLVLSGPMVHEPNSSNQTTELPPSTQEPSLTREESTLLSPQRDVTFVVSATVYLNSKKQSGENLMNDLRITATSLEDITKRLLL